MKLKKFLKNFNYKNPSWEDAPKGFPDVDISNLNFTEKGKYYAVKAVWEIEKTKRNKSKNKSKSKTRDWETTEGYRFLVQWTNLVLLRILIRKFTKTLPKQEYRTKTQLDDAARSFVSNIEEGWKRATTKEYLNFLGYTQGSLEEVKGDLRKCMQDDFIKSVRGSGLSDLGINLAKWKTWCGENINSSKLLYFPLEDNKGTLKDLKGNQITFEQLIELVNKSDFLLRKLVKSLEEKQEKDRRDEINKEIDKIQHR